jgi:hypothetical protein
MPDSKFTQVTKFYNSEFRRQEYPFAGIQNKFNILQLQHSTQTA